MPRPYILSHNDKWFVFLGCALVALCTSKEEALEVQRDWIRRSQALLGNMDETIATPPLAERSQSMTENGNIR